MRTRRKLCDADSSKKCIQDAANETFPVLVPRNKFALAPAETRSTYDFVCATSTTGDFNQEIRLIRRLRRRVKFNRENKRTSRANEVEKEWEDKNLDEAYVLLRQYSGKMKRCSPFFNTANEVAVGEASPSI
ncbi:hypothetical protein RB195_014692 [Necator americanus]